MIQNSCQKMWEKCLEVIRDIVSEAAYNTWFIPIEPLSYENKKFTIQVPSQFFYEYLEEKYINVLRVTLHRVFGEGTSLNYRVMVDRSSGGTVDYPAEQASMAVSRPNGKEPAKSIGPFSQVAQRELDSQLNPKYNFDNFLEGASNKLVRTAGETVAQNPGKTTFNPLFVYGPSGVGKTHLCHAIGIRIRELHPEKRVLYVSSHLFRVQFIDAVRKNTTNDFLNFYQGIDVLILDDIQELIGLDKTQNTFFHIFNHLHQLGKQLVLTSDKAPVDLQGLEERLITRLKWGLTAEVNRPDLDLRKKILRNKIAYEGITVPDEVFEFIATNVTENVRDLEGILVSLMANALINNREIDLPLAKRVIGQAVRLEKKEISVQRIQEVVCDYFNLEQAQILTTSRKREIVQARQITMFLAKKYTNCSLARIGKIVGKKDHATVLHACKTVKDQIEINKKFRSSIEAIEGILR
ncbi:chromosomal replication initiator protein DnaA [Parabacteroides sp. Marseille-P3160]|uniref:chromosomal replication initiator protein DnaA n=1 Tax=Parabacteroides sp. Marseille-P3160 TaxID=1917887 RepID=UPI000B420FB9|nr:chromosomal replication initiator protein DnaA [Parabacteroides sp. Marseille-P3160]